MEKESQIIDDTEVFTASVKTTVRMTGNLSSTYDDLISQTRELVTHSAVSKSV